jgi:biotin carboxylase
VKSIQQINKLNVLITGCFAPGTSGTVFGLNTMGIKNLEIYGIDLKLVSEFIPGFNKLYQVSDTEMEYINEVMQIVKKHKIDIILPQTNSEIILLSKHLSLFLGICKVALAGDFESIKTANDKFAIIKAARKLNIPSLDCVSLVDEDSLNDFIEKINAESNTFYMKARNNSGGRGTIKVVPDELFFNKLIEKPESFHMINFSYFKKHIMKNGRLFADFFVMENFEGSEYTVDVFKSTTNFIAIPRKRIKIRSGVSQINKIEENRTLINASNLLSASLNLKGLFGFQFIYKSETDFTILECNPRIQGTNYASILSGSNLIEYLVLDLMNHEFEVKDPKWNQIFMRTSGGVLIDSPQ